MHTFVIIYFIQHLIVSLYHTGPCESRFQLRVNFKISVFSSRGVGARLELSPPRNTRETCHMFDGCRRYCIGHSIASAAFAKGSVLITKMCSGEGTSKRLNYYVECGDVETPPLKKQCVRGLSTRRAVRLLGRRYALTTTGYKFLDIGINVGPPSYVEIAIADHRGNKLPLSLETWKRLYEQRGTIMQYLRNQRTDVPRSIGIGPLTVRFTTLHNTVKLVCLESSNIRMTMTESTLCSMFNLDGCIDVMFDYLTGLVENVDAKFTQFTHIASTISDNTNVVTAIRASHYFNADHLIDCELLALLF